MSATPTHALDFVLAPASVVPEHVIDTARRHLLDLVGVAAAGSVTPLAAIAAEHARESMGAGSGGARLLFDGRRASAVGAAFAGATRIDSIDAHDGHPLTKGHVGCGLLPAALAAAELRAGEGGTITERELLATLAIGYEIGTRAGIALHRTAADYHTSGAWVALAAAAAVARTLELDPAATREAIGIAEYHGPRSPMMRVIDHPSMLKDGSGWGAMAGVSAALLARRGYTGAPAETLEGEAVADLWEDLGTRWRIAEHYVKPYPVCRWAQPAIAAALGLRAAHAIAPDDIARVRVGTFHEAARLDTRTPVDTEGAQYSLPFPVATALVRGEVGVREITGEGLRDERVRRLSGAIEVHVVPAYAEAFPARRWSEVEIELRDGRRFASGRTAAAGDAETPLDDAALAAKFASLAVPVLGERRGARLLALLERFGDGGSLSTLDAALYAAP